jgi:DNA polymerase (family 10)
MKNQDVAVILARIADILQINGENWYKAQAYRKAANSISNLDEDISIIYEKGRIKDIPGVGNAIEAKIGEIIQTGSCEYYEKLIKEVPLGVLEMINIEGLGYKSVKIIHDNLGIESLEELLLSCQKGEIRNILVWVSRLRRILSGELKN